jgi:hypothetical protein
VAYDVPVDATTRAITATAMDGDGRRMEGRRMGLDPSSTRPSGIDGSDGVRRDLAHGLLGDLPPIAHGPVGWHWQAG